MNARMKDALDETLILSDKLSSPFPGWRLEMMIMISRIIKDLITEIVSDIGALYKASEAVRVLTTC